ncbi:MAG: GNAT family N-acetyltransferase, partial [Gammaproteobacteria bacterium]
RLRIVIRAARSDDAEVIAKIYVDSWNAGFGSRMPHIEAEHERVERWRRDLGEATPTRWWVAEQLGTVVGFVGIGPCRDPVDPGLGELDTIAVAPSEWHKGVGKALMSVALEGLRSHGYRSAALWTLSRYVLGESFYVSTGWRLNGTTRDDGNQVRYDHDLRGTNNP